MTGHLVIAPSAHKHGVSEEDIRHAYAHPIRVFELDEGFTMVIGANKPRSSMRSVWLTARALWSSSTQ